MPPPSGGGRVEVRGVEPRSVEPSAPASPSAVVSELSATGTLTTSFPAPIRSWLGPTVPKSRGGRPALRRPAPTVRDSVGRTGYLFRQPVRSYLRHLLVFPVC